MDYGQTVSPDGYTFIELARSDGLSEAVLVEPRRFRFSGDKESLEAYNALLRSDRDVSLDLKNDAVLLFREFGQIREAGDTQSAILEFANRYGLLGAFCVFPTPTYGDIKAESEVTWFREAGEMNHALKRHDLIMTCRSPKAEAYEALKARERLQRLFFGYEIEVMGETGEIGDEWLIREGFKNTPNLLKLCDEGDFENAELAYVGLLIDRKLRKYTSLKMAWNDRAAKLTMQYRAHNLLGAMWLQFTEYVTEVRQFNFCRVCGKPIPIIGRNARKDKDLCGGGCRSKASRQGNTVRKSHS